MAQHGTNSHNNYRPLSLNPFDPFMQDLSTRTATQTRLEQGSLSHVIVESRGDCDDKLQQNGLSGCLTATWARVGPSILLWVFWLDQRSPVL
ncbi:hypothetical protein BELL_0084g00140 [Botrytis elliptica]|uniref:Uncharacterized protein n=1 Tax=Botrytis elliptica TaxID=278938 RepID=A0A4Z1JVN4_9HELO|nr:hypothetical protein BELL_0084g00140 [Botrytis elliptica]